MPPPVQDAKGDEGDPYAREHLTRAEWHEAHATAHRAEAAGDTTGRDAALSEAEQAAERLRQQGQRPC